MVMREGKACGLMSRSGRMPVRAQNGMSTSGHCAPSTPFWPARDANLSPMTGVRARRRHTVARWMLAPRLLLGSPKSVTRCTTACSSPLSTCGLLRPEPSAGTCSHATRLSRRLRLLKQDNHTHGGHHLATELAKPAL